MWNRWERVVAKHYEERWFVVIQKNFTIPGWEIDIIVENEDSFVFVEVKSMSCKMDLYNYLSKKKLRTLKKTIEAYLRKHKMEKQIRMDIVFVLNWKIIELYENITNN